jgi:hypothetical protein
MIAAVSAAFAGSIGKFVKARKLFLHACERHLQGCEHCLQACELCLQTCELYFIDASDVDRRASFVVIDVNNACTRVNCSVMQVNYLQKASRKMILRRGAGIWYCALIC